MFGNSKVCKSNVLRNSRPAAGWPSDCVRVVSTVPSGFLTWDWCWHNSHSQQKHSSGHPQQCTSTEWLSSQILCFATVFSVTVTVFPSTTLTERRTGLHGSLLSCAWLWCLCWSSCLQCNQADSLPQFFSKEFYFALCCIYACYAFSIFNQRTKTPLGSWISLHLHLYWMN